MPGTLKLLTVVAAVVATVMTSAVCMAHPGHGLTDPSTVTHHVVEPLHAVPWGMLVTVVVIASLVLTRSVHRGVSRKVSRRG